MPATIPKSTRSPGFGIQPGDFVVTEREADVGSKSFLAERANRDLVDVADGRVVLRREAPAVLTPFRAWGVGDRI